MKLKNQANQGKLITRGSRGRKSFFADAETTKTALALSVRSLVAPVLSTIRVEIVRGVSGGSADAGDLAPRLTTRGRF